VFVSKLGSDLTSLLASTFIGTSSYDEGSSIALDRSGNVYLTGHTYSSNFPTTPGAYQTSGRGVFVSKLNNTLSTLLNGTVCGGNILARGNSLALDGCGNVYVTGYTNSSAYPTTPRSYDETFNGGNDVLISKFDSTLSFLFASTFLGGDSEDYSNALAFDKTGNVYVAGRTNSSGYPTTSGAYDESYNGGTNDVFVSKLDGFLSADDYSGSGFQAGSFLADTGPSFVFDADGDGVLTAGCNQLMLCKGQIATVDVWLHGWNSTNQGNVSAVNYRYTWDPAKLEVLSVSCTNPSWTSYNTPSVPGTGSFDLQVSSASGVSGTDFKLHTITFRVKDLTMPSVEGVYAVDGW